MFFDNTFFKSIFDNTFFKSIFEIFIIKILINSIFIIKNLKVKI